MGCKKAGKRKNDKIKKKESTKNMKRIKNITKNTTMNNRKVSLIPPKKVPTILINTLAYKREQRMIGLDRAGCWTLKECVSHFLDNLNLVKRLHLLRIICLLKESDMIDQNLIKYIAASHLQTNRRTNKNDLRFYYDIGYREFERIRSEYFPMNSLEENGCKEKLYSLFQKHKKCCYILNNSQQSLNFTDSTSTEDPSQKFKMPFSTIKKPDNITTESNITCSNNVIPFSNYCVKHIHYDKKQVLFKHCQFEILNKEMCNNNTMLKCSVSLLLNKSNSIYCEKHEFIKNFISCNKNSKKIIDMPDSNIYSVYNYLAEKSDSNIMTPCQDENNPIKSSFDPDKHSEQSS